MIVHVRSDTGAAFGVADVVKIQHPSADCLAIVCEATCLDNDLWMLDVIPDPAEWEPARGL